MHSWRPCDGGPTHGARDGRPILPARAYGPVGYEPVRADDGASALREIARKPPDAVVLDLGLPDMDGKAALAKARAFYTGPIIILSARDRETEKIDALDAGADDYVEKPFGIGELLARALEHDAIVSIGEVTDDDRRGVDTASCRNG